MFTHIILYILQYFNYFLTILIIFIYLPPKSATDFSMALSLFIIQLILKAMNRSWNSSSSIYKSIT